MRTLKSIALPLAVLLGLAGSAFAEEKWTPAQQEVVDEVQAWSTAFRAGNVEKIIGHTAPSFSCWDFARPDWQDRESFQKSETRFYTETTVLEFELTPVSVRREGDTAVVHGRHRMKVRTTSGAEKTSQGSWSSSLVRRDGRWLFTGLSWVDDQPETSAARAALEAYVVDFWSKRDTTALARSMSPYVVYHYNGEVIPASPADHLTALHTFTASFPDLVGTIDQFTFSGDVGAAATTWTGTHMGELAGVAATGGRSIPPTGRKISWTVNYLFRLEGGRIAELWESWDEGGVYQRLIQPESTSTSASTVPAGAAPAASPGPKITLVDAPLEKRLGYAVWRTDYYICTGIAYAKSLGQSVEDFASFVGNHHGITDRTAGLPKAAQLCHFVLTNYPKGQVVMIAESATSFTMRANRAYADFFQKGPVMGVTLDEFERCLWGHLVTLFGRNGFDFAYWIEGDHVTFTVSLAG